MKPLVIIRPQPGSDSSLSAAKVLGLDAHAYPLFEVHPLPWDMPDPDTFDALLIGSANAIRHGGTGLNGYTGKPVYAVGASTAQVCRDAGFDVAATGGGVLQEVLTRLDPGHRRLLRLAGAARVTIDPPPGVTLVERVVYSSDPKPMPDALADLLQRQPCVVALHSAEAAGHFRSECERLGIDRARITIAAIGSRVSNAANGGWHDVEAAAVPSEEALLVLARRMCEGAGEPQPTADSARDVTSGSNISRQGPMQDQTGASAIPAVPPPRRTVRGQIAVAVMAFALGAALVAWSAWRGYLDTFIPVSRAPAPVESGVTPAGRDHETANAMTRDERARIEAVSTVEARLAMLEDRFSRLNFQADVASGHAARAENLLIAFAARRMIDRGEPLRYLADQLQLRFANSQPRAVRTILEFARSPVTADGLSARLEALAPELAGESRNESFWHSAWRTLSDLFTVRREASSVVRSEARIERARVMLRAGRISDAIAAVKRLPGADAAATWIVDAQRYSDAQHALDLIETAAMLEPTRLQNSEVSSDKEPNPLATPTPGADAAAKAEAEPQTQRPLQPVRRPDPVE